MAVAERFPVAKIPAILVGMTLLLNQPYNQDTV